MNYYDDYLIIKCLFFFNENRKKYFPLPISYGARMSCWVGDNVHQNTASSAIEVSSDQETEDVFEIKFVLLRPKNLGDRFDLGCILSFGTPDSSIGEGKVIEMLGYWEGLVP